MSLDTILISGTTSGIGNSLLTEYQKKNHTVITINRKKKKNFEYSINGRTLNFNFSLNDDKSYKEMLQILIKKNKMPDIVYLNAGINLVDNETYLSINKFKQVFDINFYCQIKLFTHLRRINKSIHYFIMSSTSNIIPNANNLGYYISKLSITKFFEVLQRVDNLNTYSILILGPIKTRITRNQEDLTGISKIIYNLLVIDSNKLTKKLIKQKKKNNKQYITKLSFLTYYIIKIALYIFPGLYYKKK